MDNTITVLKQLVLPFALIAIVGYLAVLVIDLLRKGAAYFEAGAKDKQVSTYDKALARVFTGLANGAELALNMWADGKIKNMDEAKKFAVNYAINSYRDSAEVVKVAEQPAALLPAAEAVISRARQGREVAGLLSVGTGSLGPVDPYERPSVPPLAPSPQAPSQPYPPNVTPIDRS